MSHYSEFERRDAVRFQKVMSQAPMGAALVEQGGRFLSANKALLDLVGAPSEDAFLAQGLTESGSFKSSTIRKLVAGLDGGGQETTFDAEWVSTWGKTVNARIFITRLKTDDGRTVYQVFYEDLAHKRSEGENALTWSTMLDASSNEFYVFDQTTLKFLHVSQRGLEQLGYSLDEIKEMTPLDINPELTARDIELVFDPLLLGEATTLNRQLQQRRKNGSLYLVDVSTQCTTFAGEPAFLTIAQDITYNMEMAAALTQAQLFLNSAPDPTIIVNEVGTIQFASDRTGALLGYEREELIGLNVDDLVPDSQRDRHADLRVGFSTEQDARVMGNGRVVQAQRKDGSIVPVEVTLSPIQTKDGLLVAAAHRDVTERIETEKALQAARDEAERATEAKSAFLAAASHDLRQPLQSMSGYLWALQQKLDTPDQRSLAARMETSLEGVSELLNALLDISKLDSGAVTPDIETFEIQTLCAPILSTFQPKADEKSLTLICEGAPHLVRTDRALLTRILENLVGNALRYTDEGEVRVHCQQSGDTLDVSVSDTGLGIPSDKLDDIFDEYFQLDNDARERAKGLGLGLSIVKRVADLLGCPLSVTSTQGEGSRFTISVPLAQAEDAPSADPSIPSSQDDKSPTAKILLVDDDPGVLDSTTIILELKDCHVAAASDCDAAMEYIRAGFRPDILVTDYRLPGCLGTELIGRVREALKEDLPAILITGDTSNAELIIAGAVEAEVLHKPTKADELISAIGVMLRNRSTLSG